MLILRVMLSLYSICIPCLILIVVLQCTIILYSSLPCKMVIFKYGERIYPLKLYANLFNGYKLHIYKVILHVLSKNNFDPNDTLELGAISYKKN